MFTSLTGFRSKQLIRIVTNYYSVESKQIAIETSLEPGHIEEAIKLAPVLSSSSDELWKKSHELFNRHGLNTISFLRIVTGNPSLLARQPKKIVQSLEYWRSCQFGEPLLLLLITKYPTLLDVSDGLKLLKQVSFLKEHVWTNKNVWKVLMNSPEIIQQSQDDLNKKMNYLRNIMRIEVPEIVKSAALSKSLFDIRCRHVFLERLGLFKPRPIKADPEEPTRNHRLYQITDTSDKKFATKIAHVTLAGFETFQELYNRELNRSSEVDDDDEDFL